jgi:3-dehydroquinate dehydratase
MSKREEVKMKNFEIGSYLTTKDSNFTGKIVEAVQKSDTLVSLRLVNNAGVEKWTSVKIAK